ncbi:MAG: ABC transporter ATP-binding protein [Defluviitaleaceae bacterium]|nr:ABC transporter ATP-binding protein [Defluviitaleaceae bacterium]MCL2275630.1 ABC transporter ATP-binding protein [Defluviitaleaceae bacterium]
MLTLNDVTYRYKKSDRDAIKNVSCVFEASKLTAVIGASGSGKTTLLSILAGLDKPRSGDVFIEEDNLTTLDLDKYRRERVSMIFQAFHLFPLMTCIENVCYPMKMNGSPHYKALERAKKYLTDVGISAEKYNRYPANLSGGEQQRVAIARALSTGAKVLLADEPTGNLDVENGEIVIEVLKRLAHKEGYCIVVVTHNLDIAQTCDVVYKMSDGILKAV